MSTNRPPVPVITAPANRTLYQGGDRIDFAGTASDPEDGALGPARFTWWVDFHHDQHLHPFLAPTTGSAGGSFQVPRRGETSVNVFYRIHLRATDAAGRSGETFVDVVPKTALLQLATVPAGLRVTLDGQPITTPASVPSVVGVIRTLGVVSPQVVDGKTWLFQSWSDGRTERHDVRTPAGTTTYTARYRRGNAGEGTGLTGTYFDEVGFNGKRVVRLDPVVDFDWGRGRPAPGIERDTFSVRWTGKVEPVVSGDYTFTTVSDDGIRLWIGGKLVIDHWGSHTAAEARGVVTLQAGQLYDIRIEYQERRGEAVAKLLWQAPGLRKQVVPKARLYPAPAR